MMKTNQRPGALAPTTAKSVTAPATNRPGRPTKATPVTLATLAAAIAMGLTDEQAADLAGVCRDTVSEWRKAGGEFSDAIKKATAQRLAARLERIERGAPGWQGTDWILERTMRGQFAPPTLRQDLKHSGEVHATVRAISDEENTAIREARRRYLERMNVALPAAAASDGP